MSEEATLSRVNDLWQRVKMIYFSTLQSVEERSQAERYFSMITRVEGDETNFIVNTTNPYASDFLRDNYGEKLQSCFNLAGAAKEIKIVFQKDPSYCPAPQVNEPQKIAAAAAKSAAAQRQPSAFISTMPLNPDYTFDQFVSGPSNSFALASAVGVVSNPGESGSNPLFIHGGTGLGKTHLMQSIGNELKRQNPSLAICYLTAETFLNEYVNNLKSSRIQEFRDRYRSLDVLLLDDVQFFQRGKDVQEEFFNTFNALKEAKKQIVMTSDVAPRNLPAIEARLISRFEGGIVQEIESPSYETRLAILKKKAETLGAKVPNSVLEFIADNIKSHVRAMEGALSKVRVFMRAVPNTELNNDILAHLLKDIIEKERVRRMLTIEEIQTTIAKKYSVNMAQILSSERTQSIVTPRQLAMFVSRKLTTKSLQEIATAFDKSHATILHGVKTIKERLETEAELKLSLEEIVSQLGYKLEDAMD